MPPYITRALESVVRRYSQFFKGVVVTGPRQAGKTTMLKHLMKEDLARGIERAYVTLDNTAMRLAAQSDPELFLQRYRPPILIDEIQKAPELLPYIKIELDNSDEPGRYWLTGSQPLHLMKAVSESLAGRVGIIEMSGLSDAEIRGVETVPFEPSARYFQERAAVGEPWGVDEVYRRIWAGSLPGIRLLPDDMHAAGWESYIDTYVMRDLRDLAKIDDELKFRRFMAACAALTSRPVVYAELGRLADVDEKTAKSWLSLLASTHLVHILGPYANNLLNRLVKQPIMHFMDPGLAAYLAGWDSPRTLELGAMSGQIFETFVFGEIYKSYSNCGLRPPLSFFRNAARKEIDLVLERDGALFPIEIKKSAMPKSADAKNFSALAPVAARDVPQELAVFKREVGMGAVVCMTSDTYPLTKDVWAFPAWAI